MMELKAKEKKEVGLRVGRTEEGRTGIKKAKDLKQSRQKRPERAGQGETSNCHLARRCNINRNLPINRGRTGEEPVSVTQNPKVNYHSPTHWANFSLHP